MRRPKGPRGQPFTRTQHAYYCEEGCPDRITVIVCVCGMYPRDLRGCILDQKCESKKGPFDVCKLKTHRIVSSVVVSYLYLMCLWFL